MEAGLAAGFLLQQTHADGEVSIPDGLLSRENVLLHLPACTHAEHVHVFLHTQAGLIHHLECREAVSWPREALPLPLFTIIFPEDVVMGQ